MKQHRPGIEPVQVAGEGWRYWGTCACGWRAQARFGDRAVAEQAAANHVNAQEKEPCEWCGRVRPLNAEGYCPDCSWDTPQEGETTPA